MRSFGAGFLRHGITGCSRQAPRPSVRRPRAPPSFNSRAAMLSAIIHHHHQRLVRVRVRSLPDDGALPPSHTAVHARFHAATRARFEFARRWITQPQYSYPAVVRCAPYMLRLRGRASDLFSPLASFHCGRR